MATQEIITLTSRQISELYALIDSDLDYTEISIGHDPETGEGLFCWFTEYPEEGYFDLAQFGFMGKEVNK